MAFDGLYYVDSVTTTIKRGSCKQSFRLTRNGLVSITRWCRYERRAEILREVSRHGLEQYRPHANGAVASAGAGRRRVDSDLLGHALFSASGKQMAPTCLPQIGAGVWVEFEQGNMDYPIWSGCWYGSVAEVPVLALAGIPASPNIVLQTTAQNAIVISDVPGRPAASC